MPTFPSVPKNENVLRQTSASSTASTNFSSYSQTFYFCCREKNSKLPSSQNDFNFEARKVVLRVDWTKTFVLWSRKGRGNTGYV